MSKKRSSRPDAAAQMGHERYLENFRLSPGAVHDAWDRLDKKRRAIVAGAGGSKRKGGGSDDDDLRDRLSQVEAARHALLTAMPAHSPLVRFPLSPRMGSGPRPRPGLVYQRTAAPYISGYDAVSLDRRGVFDIVAESPATDHAAGVVGSRFRATAMSGAVADFTSIQFARDSGIVVPFRLERPTQLAVSVDFRLRGGGASAVYFDKRPGDVYCSIYEYHVPFVFLVPPIPAIQLFSEAFPGRHGLQFYWSKTGGVEESFSTPPADAGWDFTPFRLVATTNRLEPADYPDGVNFIVGMQHRVVVLAQFVRFDVDSDGRWGVDFVDVIEV